MSRTHAVAGGALLLVLGIVAASLLLGLGGVSCTFDVGSTDSVSVVQQVTGTVRASSGSTAISGALVVLGDGSNRYAVTTDANGQFTVGSGGSVAIDTGKAELEAFAVGYAVKQLTYHDFIAASSTLSLDGASRLAFDTARAYFTTTPASAYIVDSSICLGEANRDTLAFPMGRRSLRFVTTSCEIIQAVVLDTSAVTTIPITVCQ